MKKTIYLILSLMLAGFSSCSDDDKLPNVKPTDRGTVTDNQGNIYEWVRIGDLMWTTTNAINGTSLAEAKYYNNFEWDYVLPSDAAVEEYETNYLPKYGNPMSYEEAMTSAPDGWRLPSDEDWQKLEKKLGISNPDKNGFRGDGVAYSLTSADSGCGLHLLLGGNVVPIKNYGWIEMNLDFIGEHGYYWTSTVDPSYDIEQTMVYYRRITANYGKVYRGCIRSDCYMNVRWVKDAE